MITPARPDLVEPGEAINVRQFLDVFKRRKWSVIAMMTGGVLVAACLLASGKPVYRASARMLINPPSPFIQSVDSRDQFSGLVTVAVNQGPETQAEVLKSQMFLERVYDKLRLTPQQHRKLIGIAIEPVEEMDVIQVTVDCEEREGQELAQRLANGIVTHYIDQTKEAQLKTFNSTRDHFDKELRSARLRLKEVSQRLLDYRQRTDFKTDQADDLMYHRAMATEDDLKRARADLRETEAVLRRLRVDLGSEPEQLPAEHQPNPEYQKLEGRLEELERQRELALGTHRENSLPVIEVNGRIATTRADLVRTPETVPGKTKRVNPERIRLATLIREHSAERDGLQERVNNFVRDAGPDKTRLQQAIPQAAHLDQLEREKEQARQREEQVSDVLHQLDVKMRALPETVRMLEPAGPGVPMSPRARDIILLGLVIGCSLGLALALGQEYLDNRVHSPEDAEGLTSLPTLGVVPMIPHTRNPTLTDLDSGALVTECYRAIRTAVQFSSVDNPIRTMVVTSAKPGEGKTVTAINLATVMAFQGLKVILVDADLRRPSMHKFMEVSTAPGLTDVVAGQISLREALRPTKVENLRVLPCGERAPNPAELLGSEAMTQAIESLRLEADLVIFDTPPCLPVTDAEVLASQVDAVTVVIEAGRSQKDAVKSTMELLFQVRARVIGVILNKIDQSRKGAYYHYYYYRGGYRHYGDAEESEGSRRVWRRTPAELTDGGSRDGERRHPPSA